VPVCLTALASLPSLRTRERAYAPASCATHSRSFESTYSHKRGRVHAKTRKLPECAIPSADAVLPLPNSQAQEGRVHAVARHVLVIILRFSQPQQRKRLASDCVAERVLFNPDTVASAALENPTSIGIIFTFLVGSGNRAMCDYVCFVSVLCVCVVCVCVCV